MPNTIALTTDPRPIVKTFKANAAITPGHLVELMSTGKIRAHATAGGTAIAMFAMEDDQGNPITTDYAANDMAKVGVFPPGSEVYALLANGEAAVVGSKLESYGDGTLRVVDADASTGDIGVQSVVAEALEAVDMSDSSAVDPDGRIIVQIL